VQLHELLIIRLSTTMRNVLVINARICLKLRRNHFNIVTDDDPKTFWCQYVYVNTFNCNKLLATDIQAHSSLFSRALIYFLNYRYS